MEAVQTLGGRLHGYWQRFAECFRTKTRDGAPYAYTYLSGLLRMDAKRNFANIGRQSHTSGQNIQHFMSNSPWSAQEVIRQVQREVIAKPGFQRGGVLIIDESAEEKAGEKSAGAARQYNGRLGKVDLSQVGVFLAYSNISRAIAAPTWFWVDGELYLPEPWFAETEPMIKLRERLGIPEERQFATKVELGWRMIERAVTVGLGFELVACDDNYGRSRWLRDQLDQAGLVYMADVPSDTQVYLAEPTIGVPERGSKGRPPLRERVLSDERPVRINEVASREDTTWQVVHVRACERGEIADEFAVRQVWAQRAGGRQVPDRPEWLVIRREANGRLNYSLSNAAPESTPEQLAWLKCQRYFIERANQDAKSELGWDEFQAQKYRAWEHELALTVLASWFIAETKLDWARQFARDPALAGEFALEVLPRLSTANVREMLRATMPLPQLTPKQATDLVVEHLVNRTRAKKSRSNRRHNASSSPSPGM